VFLALALAACGRPRPAASGSGAGGARRKVSDGLGREVDVPVRVVRVVSLAPSSTEILFALGAGALVVGVDKYSDYPPNARTLARVGADVDPSLERIVALRPDVVFAATSANSQGTVEALGRFHIPVYVSRAESLSAILDDVRGIGRVIDRGDHAARLVTSLEARIDVLKKRVAAEPAVLSLVVVWPEPLVVAGHRSHVSDLVEAAGGRNVADDSTQAFPAYSLDRMIKAGPQVIVVGTHSDGGAPSLEPFLRLPTLPAVRDHRVFTLDGDLLFRPGPRVVEGAEALARLFHPEAR
jgi:iron complex transport system substrate-binding protein